MRKTKYQTIKEGGKWGKKAIIQTANGIRAMKIKEKPKENWDDKPEPKSIADILKGSEK